MRIVTKHYSYRLFIQLTSHFDTFFFKFKIRNRFYDVVKDAFWFLKIGRLTGFAISYNLFQSDLPIKL